LTIVRNDLLSHTFAQSYLALGYAVIPVYDNKVAAVEWKPYQRRRPTENELQQWFVRQLHANVAIITGAISRLVVLDFDDPALFQQFKTQYSDLAGTRTIQTKRGYHLYYHLPPQLHLASRKLVGVDLLSDGRYAIAPPSTIDGYTYKVTRGGQSKTLDLHDITRIQGFLNSLTKPIAGCLEHSHPLMARSLGKAESFGLPEQRTAASDLVGLYRYLASREGRNEALFKVSLRARDAGWDIPQTVALLADKHVQQQRPDDKHCTESACQRYREAEKTIHSAFSRPARMIRVSEPIQLPNTVREAFLRCGQTGVVRVIEGLRLKGIQSGQSFTVKYAVSLLKGIVGRDSVYKALDADLSPSPGTLTHAIAAKTKNNSQTTKCFVVTSSKSGKSPRHRPARVFIMPGNPELAAKLGVSLSRISDPITKNDLLSAKKTRQAVHRELIKRRPGQYSSAWLAARLGVSVSTEQRYNQEIPITVMPMYTETPLLGWNLARVPDDVDVPGLFLQDERGKRYPARRLIACKLMGKSQRVSLMRRVCNYYCYGEYSLAPGNTVRHHEQRLWTLKPGGGYRKPYLTCFVVQRAGLLPTKSVQHEQASTSESDKDAYHPPLINKKPRLSQRKYRKPLADFGREALAQRLYALVGSLNPDNHISEINARKLVDQYDARLVERALKRVGRDQRIYNPAGFIVTYLRSEAKAKGR
jgi:hypothetical protein